MTATISILHDVARRMAAERGGPLELYFMTDRRRIADPQTVASALPAGATVILRDYDLSAGERRDLARSLRAATAARGVGLLIAADPSLAEDIGADGVHAPRWANNLAAEAKARRPAWRVTVSAHGSDAPAELADEADAVFLSPVFPTRSHPGAPALGLDRAARLAAAVAKPVIALGGVNAETAPRLIGRGFAGLAAIGAFASKGQ